MKELIEKINKMTSFFPLDEIMNKSLKDFLDVKYNYNTNAIEGTTLSEKETSLVLRWKTIPRHSLVEHFEVINHKNAFDFIFELTNWFEKSKNTFEEIFTEKNILKIHSFLLNNINNDYAGKYRRQNVRIAFSRTVLPRYEKVYDLMKVFFEEKIKKYKKLSKEGFSSLNNLEKILEFWYELHTDFVKIHPFVDWNWRTARLIMNMWFLYSINNINIVYFKNRQDYIESLENFDKDKEGHYDFMNKNFLEFKSEELEIIENNILYKY